MPLPTSGPISLLDIQNEFGGTAPIGMDEYYGAAAGIPGSGLISLNAFYGATAGITISDSFELFREVGDNKGTPVDRVLTYQGAPAAITAWAGNAATLMFPKTTPFVVGIAIDGNATNWPLYQAGFYSPADGVYVFNIGNTGATNSQMVFCSARDGISIASVSLNRTIVGGGLYQNGTLLYSVTGASVQTFYETVFTVNFTAAVIQFNGDIWPDLYNRSVAGNVSGYELRLVYAP